MIDRRRYVGNLSPRDRAMTDIGVEQLRVLPHVSIAELTGTGVPPRIDLIRHRDTYRRLGKEPISVFTSTTNGEEEYTVVGPRINPEDLLALVDFVSPDKYYPADIGDILGHWDEMMGKRELKGDHRKRIPGWTDFEPSGQAVIDYLRDNSRPDSINAKLFVDHKDPNDVLIPVFRWRADKTIILSPLNEGEKQKLVRALPDTSIKVSQLNEAVGLAYLAAFSPNITKEWESQSTYHPKDATNFTLSTQFIDFIQSLAFTYRMIAARQEEARFVPDRQDLQASSLLPAFEDYAKSGIPPAYDALQAIRRYATDFFAGYDLTRKDTYYPSTTISATIDIAAEGNYYLHKATSSDGINVTFMPEPNDAHNDVKARYILSSNTPESEKLQLELTDYKDKPSGVEAYIYNYYSKAWRAVDLDSEGGKQLIEDAFDITFP